MIEGCEVLGTGIHTPFGNTTGGRSKPALDIVLIAYCEKQLQFSLKRFIHQHVIVLFKAPCIMFIGLDTPGLLCYTQTAKANLRSTLQAMGFRPLPHLQKPQPQDERRCK